MRYSEAIRRLEEDPTLVFRLVETYKTWTLKTDYDPRFPDDKSLYFIVECEGVDPMSDAGKFSGNLLTNDDRWELVKPSVTWQEALQAWAEGKDVSVVVEGCIAKLGHDDTYFTWLSERMIYLGEWYIEEKDA